MLEELGPLSRITATRRGSEDCPRPRESTCPREGSGPRVKSPAQDARSTPMETVAALITRRRAVSCGYWLMLTSLLTDKISRPVRSLQNAPSCGGRDQGFRGASPRAGRLRLLRVRRPASVRVRRPDGSAPRRRTTPQSAASADAISKVRKGVQRTETAKRPGFWYLDGAKESSAPSQD